MDLTQVTFSGNETIEGLQEKREYTTADISIEKAICLALC